MRDIKRFANKNRNIDQLLNILYRLANSKYREYTLRVGNARSIDKTNAVKRYEKKHMKPEDVDLYEVEQVNPDDTSLFKIIKRGADPEVDFYLIHIIPQEKRSCNKISCKIICKKCNAPNICHHLREHSQTT